MDDWERCCKAIKKELPKELHDKFNDLKNILEELNFEKFDEVIMQLSESEQRVWLLRKISDIFYNGESYSISVEALVKWKKEYLSSNVYEEKLNEFIDYYEEFLSEISKRNHAACWKLTLENCNCVKKSVRRKKLPRVSAKNETSDKGNCTKSVITYKERNKHMDCFLSHMDQMNVAEGIKGYYTYGDLKKDGFFCTKIKENEYKVITAEELLQDEWYLEKGYKCIVITGKLGSGKSILGCRLAENIIKSLGKEQWCLVWNSCFMEGQFGKDSKKYFSEFINKSLPKRGKLVVIIDDMGELLARGELKNRIKLFDAAQYYNATLIITCRRSFADDLKDNRTLISKIWNMLKLDIKDDRRDDIIQKLPVKDEMNEVRETPLFRGMADKMIDAYEETKEYINILENNFLFQEECYNALMRRERIKNRINDSDMQELEMFMKEVAFQMYRYQGKIVTLDVCSKAFSDKEKLQKLVKMEIFLEMIEVDKQLKENYREWYIKGFVYSWLEPYFFTKKIIDIYQQNDKSKMETINNFKVDEKHKKMIETLYFTLPEDKKEMIKNNVEKLGV